MLNEGEKEVLRQRERLYRTHYQLYERRMQLLRDVHREILSMVNIKYHEWVYGMSDVKEMLLSLQKRVKPITKNRRQTLQEKWDKDRRESNKSQKTSGWIIF
jgi:hypothetical protein